MWVLIRMSGFVLAACVLLPFCVEGTCVISVCYPYSWIYSDMPWRWHLNQLQLFCWPYLFGLVAGLRCPIPLGPNSECEFKKLWTTYAAATCVLVPGLALTASANDYGPEKRPEWFWLLLIPLALGCLAATRLSPTWQSAALLVQWCLGLAVCTWLFFVAHDREYRPSIGWLVAACSSAPLFCATTWCWLNSPTRAVEQAST
jgi:hypothetical protein